MRLPQPLNKLTFEQSKMLRLRTENMEVIIRLINSKESNPEASVSWDDDSKMLRTVLPEDCQRLFASLI